MLGVVVLERPSNNIEIQFLDLVSVQKDRPNGMLDGDEPLRRYYRPEGAIAVFSSHRDVVFGESNHDDLFLGDRC
jgi:hypothetical protein